MNCMNQPDVPAVAYCRTCGKAFCEACQRTAQGTVYCQEHLPASAAAGSPDAWPYTGAYTAPRPTPPPLADPGASPGLAFLLGLIPGVGAIYNGQYVKGLIHVIVLGVLISIVSNGDRPGGLEPPFRMIIGGGGFNMGAEAFSTPKK